MKKIALITALVIVAVLVVLNIKKSGTETTSYTEKFAPNSVAYFVCKSDGVKEGNICSKCEALFRDSDSKRKDLSITSDEGLIKYVGTQNKDCVNKLQGGN